MTMMMLIIGKLNSKERDRQLMEEDKIKKNTSKKCQNITMITVIITIILLLLLPLLLILRMILIKIYSEILGNLKLY